MFNSLITPQLAKLLKAKSIDLSLYYYKYLHQNFYTLYYYNENDTIQHSETLIPEWTPILSVAELIDFFELNNSIFIEIDFIYL